MKKFLFLIILIIIGAIVLYRLDIKPETKDVIKQVELNKAPVQPLKPTNAPPSQNVPE